MPYALLAVESDEQIERKEALPAILLLWREKAAPAPGVQRLTKSLFLLELPAGLRAASELAASLDQARIGAQVAFSMDKPEFRPFV